jgi:regulator of sirC expression with transglutaminase-like and TPR domain
MDIQDEELRDVTRAHNKALRLVNRQLRRAQERAKQEADEVVAALFDAPSEAEIAMRRIWDELGFTCRPDDYDKVVEYVLSMRL